MNIQKNKNNIFWLAPIIALAIGILPMPYGYYMLSRLVVSAGALYFAFNFYKINDNFQVWVFGFLVVLYNPIIPISLGSKELWMIVNIPTIYYFYINRNSIK
jgi:hypothetical protein